MSIDFRKVGEAAVTEYESIRRNWVASKADFKKEQEQIGKAAVAAMIPAAEEDGHCNSDCPFCYDAGVCQAGLHDKTDFRAWESPLHPGPNCPARRERETEGRK